MKYFYDTEFLEGTQKKWFKQSEPTIDLISIGIVAEDGREYYAVSKDFNLKEAWDRFQMKETSSAKKYMGFYEEREYWIRENVLKPIYSELLEKEVKLIHKAIQLGIRYEAPYALEFCYQTLKYLINKYGKANKQIAQEVKNFCYSDKETRDGGGQFISGSFITNKYPNIELYGYYSAYDHVVLCWLFGKMIDLPKGFPMYTIDLKQSFDEKQAEWINKTERQRTKIALKNKDFSVEIDLKKSSNYPKQDNEHNALDDAKWNKELYEFLKTIN